MHSSRICLLSDGEGEALRRGEELNCKEHRHCKVQEARDSLFGTRDDPQPTARYAILPSGKISKRHVVMIVAFAWRVVGQTKKGYGPGMPVWNLVRSAG